MPTDLQSDLQSDPHSESWSAGRPGGAVAATHASIAQLRPMLVAWFRRRCGDAAEAEDLAQDVIVRALKAAPELRRDHARDYVFGIAANRWRDRGRRKVVRGQELDWNDQLACDVGAEMSPERELASRQEFEQFEAAWGELSGRAQDIIVLYRLEGLRQAQIADLLGISVSAVEKHVVKALAVLRALTGRVSVAS